MWGALSDEKMGLLFTIAAGPRQLNSLSRSDNWSLLYRLGTYRTEDTTFNGYFVLCYTAVT
jgi:hypothetical protein